MDTRRNYTFKVCNEIIAIEKIFRLDQIRGAKSVASRKAITALFDPELLGNRNFLSGVFSREVIEDIENGFSIDEILERLEDSKIHGKKREGSPKAEKPREAQSHFKEESIGDKKTNTKEEVVKKVPKNKEPEKKEESTIESTGNSFLDDLRRNPIPDTGRRTKKVVPNKVEDKEDDDQDGIVDKSGGFFKFD